MTNVHRVIDELNMDATTLPGDADGEALANLLRATLDDGDRRLRKLGFNITSIRHCAGGKRAHRKQSPNLPIICCARSMRISHAMPLREARSIFR